MAKQKGVKIEYANLMRFFFNNLQWFCIFSFCDNNPSNAGEKWIEYAYLGKEKINHSI